mgnify:CR=1 FL=1
MRNRKLLEERTITAREFHECDVEEPDCSDKMIFPGDRYIRETWVHFGARDDGSKFRYIFIIKRHDSPCCMPDPRLFEEDEDSGYQEEDMKMAA